MSKSGLERIGGRNLGVDAFLRPKSIFHASQAWSGLVAFLAGFLTFSARVLDLPPFRTDRVGGRRKGVHMHRRGGYLEGILG